MALPSTSIEDICQAIKQHGFWKLDDPGIGERVDNIVNSGFRLKTVEGLGLCKASIFDNKKIRNVIDTYFAKPVLGFYKVFGQTKLNHCILNRTNDPAMLILVVHTCSSGSAMILHEGSHLCYLDATHAPNGLLAIPDERLNQPGITHRQVQIEHGGIILSDARSGWKVLKGKIAIHGQMNTEEATHWAKMHWPQIPALLDKVTEMDRESETFSKNFEWKPTVPRVDSQVMRNN